MIHISIIVCCYNSENLIQNTLEHINNQVTNEDLKVEVLLVDNNCTDSTVNIAKISWDTYNSNMQLRIVEEPKAGLCYAREKGVLESNGEILVFCDDDNLLENNYLKVAFDFMNHHPDVGALGGESEGILQGLQPEWWNSKKDSYAVGKQASKSGNVSDRGFLWGAGLIIRRSIMLNLYEAGFKSLLTGRKGAVLASGDDSEICKWVLIMGYKLWYLDKLKFSHYITSSRLNDRYFKRLKEGHKKSHDYLNIYERYIKFLRNNNSSYLSDINKRRLFKIAIKAIIKKEPRSIEKLQLAIGTHLKVDSNLYEIIKTHSNLKILLNESN